MRKRATSLGRSEKSAVLAIALAFVALSAALAAVDRDIALVLKVKGDAKVQRVISEKWEAVVRGKRLDSGDLVRTGDQTLVAIVFTDDKSMLKIRSNSDVRIRGQRTRAGMAKRIFMSLGQMWARVTGGQTDFRVETPSGVAAVKGTEFYGSVEQDGTFTVIGISGLIELFNQFGSVLVHQGETGTVRQGQAPTVQPTQEYEDWAAEEGDQEKEIEIEFEDASGRKKTLRIRYRE